MIEKQIYLSGVKDLYEQGVRKLSFLSTFWQTCKCWQDVIEAAVNVLDPHLYEDDEADEGAGDDDADVDGGQTGASLYLQAGHTLVPPVVLQLGKMVLMVSSVDTVTIFADSLDRF